MNHHQAIELLDCPHCGKNEPVRICRSSENEEWDSSNVDCFGVVCDASSILGKGPGGCGAAGGYFETRPQAIAAWNRRAAPASEPAVDRDAGNEIEALAIQFEQKIGQSPNRIITDKTSWGWRYRRAAVQREFMLFMKFTIPAAPAVPAAPLVASDVSVANYGEAVHQVFDTTCNAWEDVSIEQWMRCNASYRRVLYASPQPSGNPGEFPQSAPPSPSVDQAKRLVGGEVADSERLDWLEKFCTGASDSERYLPFRVYWGAGKPGGIRNAIDKQRASTGSATSTDTKGGA